MKFRTKMLISFSVVVSILLIIELLRSINALSVADSFDFIVNEVSPELNALNQMQVAEANMIEEALSFGLSQHFPVEEFAEEEEGEFEEAWEELQANLDRYAATANPDEADEQAHIADLRSQAQLVYDSAQQLIAAAEEDPNNPEIPELLETLEVVTDTFNASVALALESEFAELREDGEAGVISAYVRILTGLVGSGVIFFVFLADYVGFRRQILSPIGILDAAARKIASGDYVQRVPYDRKDEIGELAKSFNSMASAVQERETRLETVNKQLEMQVQEAQAARERAEKSDQVKSAFLASMSHELRTPLNSIINFSKFVSKGVMGPVNDRQTETLEKVVGSGKHLLHLINDVLDMSKIESGSLNLFIEENVNIEELLRAAVTTGEGLVADKPVKLALEIQNTLPTITADRQRVLQIVLNIISNAAKFTEEGRIAICAKADSEYITISVSDTGPGIALEDQALVFTPFQQTETGLRQGGGTGLGMPISKNLAEAHGGKMWLESIPDGGSTFYVKLPVDNAALRELIV